MREEAGAAKTLPAVIAACTGLLVADPDAVSRFESALVQAGYSPAHEDEYAKLKLRIVEEGLFRVESHLPRITVASFAEGLPAGVERVEHEVNLGGCGELLVATSPSAMPAT